VKIRLETNNRNENSGGKYQGIAGMTNDLAKRRGEKGKHKIMAKWTKHKKVKVYQEKEENGKTKRTDHG